MRVPSERELWLIDDDRSTLESLRHALEQYQWRVRTFQSALEVENALQTKVPACVVVDRAIGPDDGMALIERIRDVTWPVPAILISANITPWVAAKAMRSGFSMVLDKPFSIELLLSEVGIAFQQSDAIRRRLERQLAAQRTLNCLSDGHLAVLRELVACRPHKQIASQLDIALRTVEKRKKEIFERLRVTTFTELLELLRTALYGPCPSWQGRAGLELALDAVRRMLDNVLLNLDQHRLDAPSPLGAQRPVAIRSSQRPMLKCSS